MLGHIDVRAVQTMHCSYDRKCNGYQLFGFFVCYRPLWASTDVISGYVYAGVRPRDLVDVQAARGGGVVLDTSGRPFSFGEVSSAINPDPDPTYTAIPSGYNFSAIASGGYHACGILASNNNVVCWGGVQPEGGTATTTQVLNGGAGFAFSSISASVSWTCGIVLLTGNHLPAYIHK
jgi:hypothetical protein